LNCALARHPNFFNTITHRIIYSKKWGSHYRKRNQNLYLCLVVYLKILKIKIPMCSLLNEKVNHSVHRRRHAGSTHPAYESSGPTVVVMRWHDGIYCIVIIVIIVVHNNNRWRIGSVCLTHLLLCVQCTHTCSFFPGNVIGVQIITIIRGDPFNWFSWFRL